MWLLQVGDGAAVTIYVANKATMDEAVRQFPGTTQGNSNDKNTDDNMSDLGEDDPLIPKENVHPSSHKAEPKLDGRSKVRDKKTIPSEVPKPKADSVARTAKTRYEYSLVSCDVSIS